LKDLIDKFVCVRLVKANRLDLTLFQFDYDLTFAVFFMNADKTIYGRYGTRSSVEEASKDMSMAGLAKSMSAALYLHERYPDIRKLLVGKQPAVTKYATPNDYPSLQGKFNKELDYAGAVTKSCLHCHQVLDAQRQVYRDAGQAIPDKVLFPHPSPTVLGLGFDPETRATVATVADGSPAKLSGFQPGDELLTLDGQAILSVADIQWVLHHTQPVAELPARVRRDKQSVRLRIKLPEGWRRKSDIAWRVSSWPLRQMVTGGIVFQQATEEQRRELGIDAGGLALVIKHLGLYGPHGAAKRAGFQKGDVIIAYDGREDHMSRSELLTYGAQNTRPGQKVDVTVLRAGKRLNFQLPMQK